MFTFDKTLLPSSVSPASGSIFHYTSSAGLLGMVENRVIWASEASSLNDRSEVVMGWEFHDEWLAHRRRDDETLGWAAISSGGELAHHQSNVYVASCSTSGDDVAQWRSYAENGSGYAIELDASVQLSVWSTEPKRKCSTKKRAHFGRLMRDHAWVSPWLPAVYEKSVLFRMFDEVLDSVLSRMSEIDSMNAGPDPQEFEDARGQMYENLLDNYVTATSSVVHLYKAAGYSGENEVRILAGIPSGSPHLRFRSSGAGIVGYLPLTTSSVSEANSVLHAADGVKRPPEPLPILGVNLGSKLDSLNGTTVQRLLRMNGLRDSAVDQSVLRMR